jgi:hypothetical protein
MRLLVNFAFCFWFLGLASLAHADRIKDLASLGWGTQQPIGWVWLGCRPVGDWRCQFGYHLAIYAGHAVAFWHVN